MPAFARLTPPGTIRAATGLPTAILLRGFLTFAFFCADAYVPLVVQGWRHESAFLAGLAYMAATLTWTAGSWVNARRIERLGPGRFLRSGFAVLLVGTVGFLVILSPDVPAWLAIPIWGVAGFGMGLSYSTPSLVVLREAPPHEQGAATAGLQLSDVLGASLGTGIGGALVAPRDGGRAQVPGLGGAGRDLRRVGRGRGRRGRADAVGSGRAWRCGRSPVRAEPARLEPGPPRRRAGRLACPLARVGDVRRCGRLADRPLRSPTGGPPTWRNPRPMSAEELRAKIREIPDFPKPGILFYDITTLLKDAAAYKEAIDLMLEPYRGEKIDVVVGMESRGFIFSSAMAYQLNAGLVPVRKLGKLPAETITVEYALEYGSNTLEIHRDAIEPGQKVLIVDDLLATGGTVKGTIELIERLKGDVVGLGFLVELDFLKGRDRLDGRRVTSRHQVLRSRATRSRHATTRPDRQRDRIGRRDPRPRSSPAGTPRTSAGTSAEPASPAPDDAAVEPADLARRRFFRQFAGELIQTAATVAGAAQALQRASAEAAGAILDPVAGATRLEADAIAAPRRGAGRGPPTGFRTPFREGDGVLYLIDQRRLPDAARPKSTSGTPPRRRPRSARWSSAARRRSARSRRSGWPCPRTASKDTQPFARRAILRGGATALRRRARRRSTSSWAVDRMMARFEAIGDLNEDGHAVAAALRAEADAIVAEATTDHGRLAEFGAAALPVKDFGPLRILTHCNTGPLACGQFGTALGIVQAAHFAEREIHVWVDETRPYLQGARLTAWELAQAGVPHTLIPDVGGRLPDEPRRGRCRPRRRRPGRGQRRHGEQGRDVPARGARGPPRDPVLRLRPDELDRPGDPRRRRRSRSRSARPTRSCSSAASRSRRPGPPSATRPSTSRRPS